LADLPVESLAARSAADGTSTIFLLQCLHFIDFSPKKLAEGMSVSE
jgi:hypothetical protein